MHTEPDFDDKLTAIVKQLNTETIARGHADSTITGRLNALEKLVAEQGDDLTKRVTHALTTAMNADQTARIAKEKNDIAALATDVSNMRSVLEQLLEALSEDAADDGEHTLEQVKAAYLAIIRDDADALTVAHIETADVLGDLGDEYRVINSTHDRSWTIPKRLVAEVLDGEDDQ